MKKLFERMQAILQSSRHTDSQTADMKQASNKEQLTSKEPALSQGHWYVLLNSQRTLTTSLENKTGEISFFFLFFFSFSEDKSQDTDGRKIIL